MDFYRKFCEKGMYDMGDRFERIMFIGHYGYITLYIRICYERRKAVL